MKKVSLFPENLSIGSFDDVPWLALTIIDI